MPNDKFWTMSAGELRKLLEQVSDDTPVLVEVVHRNGKFSRAKVDCGNFVEANGTRIASFVITANSDPDTKVERRPTVQFDGVGKVKH